MVGQILWVNALVLLAVMTVVYGIAYTRRRLDTVDIGWGLAFTAAAWAAEIQAPSNRSLMVAILVSCWGLRLGLHIYQRSRFRGEDARYTELTKKWRGNIWAQAYLRIFVLQGALVWIISLPVMLLANKHLHGARWLLYVGAIIWAIGFAVEVIADRQLQRFLRDKNRPRVMQSGLWRYSRHPNYFGELTQWWGIGVMALAARYGWIGLTGPLVLMYLIIFVSGLPPIENKRAKDPAYQEYQRRTSALLLLPPKP